jgi:hypothetical protein
MKVFVAIPVYDGKLQVQTVKALLEEQQIAALSGDELHFSFLPSCSVPAMGRNQLVSDFLASGCDKLFFLDADLTWELGHLLKVARKPEDLVGGCYRFKTEDEAYPIGWLPQAGLWADENGLLEVETMPNGFLAISRRVFLDLQAAHPDRWYEHHGRRSFCYFQMIFKDGHLHSEDTGFCKDWRAIGGKVFVDPEVSLTHWDFNRPYPGHIGNWLKRNAGIPREEYPHGKNEDPAFDSDRGDKGRSELSRVGAGA